MAIAVKCGKCKGTHPSAAAVKACYTGTADPAQEFQAAKVQAKVATAQPASEKQVAFLTSLLAERDHGWEAAKVLEGLKASKAAASETIAKLLDMPKVAGVPTGPQWPNVPEGHYAVASATGNNDLDFFRVDRPTKGKWEGRTFVKRIIGGHPEFGVAKGQVKEVLDRIVAAGIDESRTLYGQEIGQCWKCNRSLTDELSRQLGIGPVCRAGGIDS